MLLFSELINFKLWLCTLRNFIYFLAVSHVRNRHAEINADWVADKCNHLLTIPPWWKISYILAKYNIFLSSSSSSYFSKSNRHCSLLTNSETDFLTSLRVGTWLHGSWCSWLFPSQPCWEDSGDRQGRSENSSSCLSNIILFLLLCAKNKFLKILKKRHSCGRSNYFFQFI